MPKRIYVGNLPFSASEDDVREMFAKHGDVNEVKLITDRDTGRPRGFGFVEMENPDEADAAISAYHQTDMDGRSLNVNEARPRTERGGGGRGGW